MRRSLSVQDFKDWLTNQEDVATFFNITREEQDPNEEKYVGQHARPKVSTRKLLEKIEFGEKREAIAISYVVERLLNLLLGLDLKDWRKVTQDEAIEAIVHFYLNLINQWDMSAASIEAAMTHLKQLVRQFAAGTLSQDEFLDLLSEEDDDEE
jgi:hypothetical protein